MDNSKSKIDVFNEETMKFIQRFLTSGTLKVLEVGCGSGDFGFELVKTGITLTALDTDEESVKSALRKGVPAKCIDFLSFNGTSFDLIIFTRSLHHIHKLKEALDHSKLLLKKGGKLIIEDFDLEMIDLNTLRWYYDTSAILSTIFQKEKSSDYVKDPIKAWKDDHYHEPPLHSGKEMIKKIEEKFRTIKIERNAYLYRSICEQLHDDTIGYHLTRRVLEIENGLITNRSILPNGLRIVAEN